MTKVVDIRELQDLFAGEAKAADIQEFADQQQKVIHKLMLENKVLKEKVAHMEGLLDSVVMQTAISGPVTPEEMICMEQIKILHERSTQRELTLDDVKRLDILVKNLRLIREMSNNTIDVSSHGSVEEADLVRIAQADSK